jgi:PPOX class probable F420-dependent enzyme
MWNIFLATHNVKLEKRPATERRGRPDLRPAALSWRRAAGARADPAGRTPTRGDEPMPTASTLSPQIEQFLHDNPQGVLTSFRRNGMPQLSIVTVYPRDGGVGISITENRMKFKNLLRDPRCSVLVSHVDWWSGFLVFEGTAELTHSGNTDPEALRLARRHVFSATTRRRSADWEEYDRIANEDKRVAMILRPHHIYGSALAKMRAAPGR